jgi:hypothetical protein
VGRTSVEVVGEAVEAVGEDLAALGEAVVSEDLSVLSEVAVVEVDAEEWARAVWTQCWLASRRWWTWQAFREAISEATAVQACLSVPCRPGTPTYKLHIKISSMAYIHALSHAPRLRSSPPC